jgi:hypothetical protein
MNRRGRRSARARQQGIALLLVMMVLLSAASYALLRSLNVARQDGRASHATSAASLAAAERALLGYAVRYPDDPDSASLAAGPGHLPCPDTRFDAGDVPGQADPPCAIGGVNGTTGLLPWRTLDIPDLRDGDGAPLWYAVDDAFRNNPQSPINPDTGAALRLDNCGATGRDIAALIVAPRAALDGQDRSTANPAVRYAAANYLEGQNASTGDACFSSAAGVAANDVVRVIDRARLIDAVQGRVLRDVANALERYHRDPDGDDDNAGVDPDCAPLPGDCDDAYPWLSPYTDPSLGPYAGTVGTRAGLLPLRRVNVDFDAGFAAQWSIPVAGTVVGTGTSPPAASCVRNTGTPCTVTPPGFVSPTTIVGPVFGTGVAPFGMGRCRWPGGTRLRCETSRSALDAASGSRLTRSYVVEVRNLVRRIAPPTASAPRTEGALLVNSSLPADGLIDITVSDIVTSAAGVDTALGSARLVLSAGAAVEEFRLSDVPFDLEISDDDVIDPGTRRSPGELPQWFAANGWQQFIAVAYAAAYAPGNAAADCTPGVDCLRLERQAQGGAATTLADVRGLVLGAGPALATQTRPSADPAQLFEDGNNSFDDVYTERPMAADFNDRMRRLGVDD